MCGFLLLAGCGFHLQGALDLPQGIDALYVAYGGSNYRVGTPPLVDALQQRLRAGGKLGDADAKAQLVIRRVRNRQHVVSISAINSDNVEYEIRSTVVFDYIVNGHPRLRNQHYSVSRYYSYNDSARLAADAERHDLIEQMQKQLANRVLFRINQLDERNEVQP